MINLSEMSLQELEELSRALPIETAKRRAETLATAKEKLAMVASEMGLSLAEIFGQEVVKGRKNKVAVAAKYRHPENHDLTWSGRGRMPMWLKEQVNAGKTAEEFAVTL